MKIFLFAVAMMLMCVACSDKRPKHGDAKTRGVEEVEPVPSLEEREKDQYNLKALAETLDGALMVMNFNEGRAAVLNKDKKLGFIDKMGHVIIPFEYDLSPASCSEGIICCRKENDSTYFFNRYGELLHTEPASLGIVGDFHEGFAIVRQGDLYGFIDRKFQPAFNGKKWRGAGPFHEGLALVHDGQGLGFIDRWGKVVIPCKYGNPADRYQDGFHEGLAPVYDRSSGSYGYINKDGEMVLTLEKGRKGERFSEGLALVREQGNPLGYIDRTGTLVLDLHGEYVDASVFSENRACVKRGNFNGFIDRDGKLVIPCCFMSLGMFNEGLAPVMKHNRTGHHAGYINRAGVGSFKYYSNE